MPACGQAVGCGVCDTPELWCGAAGLCARIRACAGAAESLHTYIHKKSDVEVQSQKQSAKALGSMLNEALCNLTANPQQQSQQQQGRAI